MKALTVMGKKIRQDAEGRYRLNDLHDVAVAAGFNRRTTEPGKFLATKTAQGLIAELVKEAESATLNQRSTLSVNAESDTQNLGITFDPLMSIITPINYVKSGPYKQRGTFAVREVCIDYAMWISPKYRLKVIRAFDAIISGTYIEPMIVNENYWFDRYPHLEEVRPLVLEGKPYKEIEAALEYKPGRVGRAVRSLCKHALMSPHEVAEVQKGPARKAALKMAEGYGKRKPKEEKPKNYPLFDGLGETA